MHNPIARPSGNHRLRVTHVLSDGGLGGAQRSVEWLAEALDRSRLDASFIFLYSGGPVLASISDMGYPVRVLNWRSGWSLVGRLRLLREVSRTRPHLLHFHEETPFTRCLLRAVGSPPILGTDHGLASISEIRKRSPLVSFFMRLDNRCTRLVLANSHWTAKAHSRLFNRPMSSIRVVYLGLSPSITEATLRPTRQVQRNGVDGPERAPSQAAVLLFVGRLEEYKGVLELPKLAKELLRLKAPPFEIRVVGEGSARQALQESAGDLGVAGQVRLLGPRNDVMPELRRADVFLFPSLWDEPFGIAPLEAVAAGIPVAAYDVGAVSEVLGPAPRSMLVPRGDIAAMAEALLAALKNRGSGCPGAGLDYVRVRFSAGRYARELMEVYEEALDPSWRRRIS